jgi:hypothetical protein
MKRTPPFALEPETGRIVPTKPSRKSPKRIVRKVYGPKETAIQATVIDWARGYGSKLDGIDMLHSIPNGALLGNPHYNRFALIGKLKAEGLRPGVLDLFLACARKGFHGFYLEAKTPDGVISAEQETWIIRAQEEGYKTAVFDSPEQAINLITKYLED